MHGLQLCGIIRNTVAWTDNISAVGQRHFVYSAFDFRDHISNCGGMITQYKLAVNTADKADLAAVFLGAERL